MKKTCINAFTVNKMYVFRINRMWIKFDNVIPT